jgi:hypothetical protein
MGSPAGRLASSLQRQTLVKRLDWGLVQRAIDCPNVYAHGADFYGK